MIATEQKVVTLNDVAKTFTNFKEMKSAAANRRHIHPEMAEVLKRGLQPQPTSEYRTDSDTAKTRVSPTPSVKNKHRRNSVYGGMGITNVCCVSNY